MKQVEVQILQQSYLLSCTEGRETRLRDAAARVDAAMTRIRDAGKVRTRERIAVLAAVNLAFDLADREAAAPAAGARAADLPEGADPRLHTLVRRLDQALGDDAQLF
ncbi:cell division protein ZapA [Verminephrobacter aporrectodeae]|uniref:Cell division protein ZapA n=1 Tax=Verminephrobacter aporrectodeae subsp. tuberculatae TaxID=1110392 RepID=A0ABT3KUP4_9BURK|nr:cell division protein ZapA [Verminephrobacter aporrectodeae]MCW5222943.1 cell division protein ZapA [Verminephrobacter aporrectodeae subsp. tuberculatae]MCW5256827.1 cell division protein ZapA [Verminephrobacter aporrectodeae subsp. tuberculatae]MCW5288407.1 cell division protein ZapA [Verminephrobacter aporrectodeae subsp. tuberculatae]MCW5322000.1 cell division protein ZapA [Verminephrobacter aporrectodeae subsp. tuberculatae]MCW8164366.1 cell division protein ZapA [Verminephrobacter apor